MHQFAVAIVTLICASSVAGLNLVRNLALDTDPQASHALPSVDAAPVAEPAAEFDPAVAAILRRLEGRHTRLSQRDVVQLAETIVEQARLHQLDPSLVLAVIQVESGYYNQAVSHVGALGLMQLMPATGEELARKHGVAWSGEESLFDPIVNVKLGTAYLKQLSDHYGGDMQTALAAYNWGPGRIDRFRRQGTPTPTEYIERVMASYSLTRRAS